MATTLAQILLRLDAVLKAQPGINTVARGRAEEFNREETPAVNVLLKGEGALGAFADDLDEHDVPVELHLHVRDADPYLAVEALHERVHQPIVDDAQLGTLGVQVRLDGPPTFTDPQDADATALTKVARYRFRFVTPRNSL